MGTTSSFIGQQGSATTCSYFGRGCNPPDMGLAASSQFVLQGVNTQWEVLDSKGNVQPGWPVSAQSFFGVPNATGVDGQPCDTAHQSQPFLSDPRALYDPADGRMIVEVEVLRYAGYRILSKLEQGTRPGSESSVDKLYYSELDKRHQELIQDILGPYGQLEKGVPTELGLNSSTARGDESTWAWNFLWSRAGTIYAGSSEIQKNIIGERVLKLPREPRADRAASAGKGA